MLKRTFHMERMMQRAGPIGGVGAAAPGFFRQRLVILALVAGWVVAGCAAGFAEAPTAAGPEVRGTAGVQGAANAGAGGEADPSLAAYRAHIIALIGLVDGCAAATNLAHCDGERVGADERVGLGTAVREVHYDWLRDALTRAVVLKQGEVSAAKKAAAVPAKSDAARADQDKPQRAADLLAAARVHLVEDQRAVGDEVAAAADHGAQRKLAGTILSEGEFEQVEHPSLWSRAVEAFLNWLNNLFSRMPAGGHSHWMVWCFEWGLVIAACTGLAWWLIQGSRRERWRLEAGEGRPEGAPSLRDWQLWLAEAETLAASGRWREAIHNVYWAAISRLESRGVWPVDRARTPREYLGLIGAGDPRREDLTALTRGFERIWYGRRAAAEAEYRNVRGLLEKLVERQAAR